MRSANSPANMTLSGAFTNRSIGARLSLLIVLNGSLALMSAGIALFGYESVLQRGAASRELSAQAGIIAESSTAALSFADERAATQTLSALRGDTQVVEGVIYDRNERPFSRYRKAGYPAASPAPQLRQAGVYFENGAVLVFQPIRLADEKIGTIFLKSNNAVTARLRQYVGIVCLVLLLSQAFAWLLSSLSNKLCGRTNGTLFRRQPHPSHQLLESRIGSDEIVAGIGVDPRMHRPFLIGLLEPLECSVSIPLLSPS